MSGRGNQDSVFKWLFGYSAVHCMETEYISHDWAGGQPTGLQITVLTVPNAITPFGDARLVLIRVSPVHSGRP
jgi:hypothetical protein